MNKKSQIRIQEMAFMLVAVFILFALVGLFALGIISVQINSNANDIKKQKSLSAITNLADTPEFSCGYLKFNCIDSDKAMALTLHNETYKELWPFNSLKIIKSSAINKKNLIPCSFNNYPNCDTINIFNKGGYEDQVKSYVALCRNELIGSSNFQKCEIALFIAGSPILKPNV